MGTAARTTLKHPLLATIDIGTNSTLLLIGEMRGGKIIPHEERAEITRLGKGLEASSRIDEQNAEVTIAVLRDYGAACRARSVQKIAIVGTEVLRRATNAQWFVDRVKQELGLDIEIISGEREAEFTYQACEMDFGEDIAVIDIGGGSTEFITKEMRVSTKLGSVVLTERFLKSDPVTESEYSQLVEYIENTLDNALRSGWPEHRGVESVSRFIATAGTATTMATMKLRLDTYDHSKVHGSIVMTEEIREIIAQLKPRTVAERMKLPGLHPKRADAILAGATILERAMRFLGFDQITVSDRGLRWGLFGDVSRSLIT